MARARASDSAAAMAAPSACLLLCDLGQLRDITTEHRSPCSWRRVSGNACRCPLAAYWGLAPALAAVGAVLPPPQAAPLRSCCLASGTCASTCASSSAALLASLKRCTALASAQWLGLPRGGMAQGSFGPASLAAPAADCSGAGGCLASRLVAAWSPGDGARVELWPPLAPVVLPVCVVECVLHGQRAAAGQPYTAAAVVAVTAVLLE